MNTEILEALGAITREKNVDRAVLVETLEAGLVSAGKKKFGATANIEVKFENVSGKIEMARVMDVVETVEDPALQTTLEKAQETHPDAVVGGQIREPVTDRLEGADRATELFPLLDVGQGVVKRSAAVPEEYRADQ